MIRDKEYLLQGNKGVQCHMLIVSNDKMDKVLRKNEQISMLQCYELQMICHSAKKMINELVKFTRIVPADMQAVLR